MDGAWCDLVWSGNSLQFMNPKNIGLVVPGRPFVTILLYYINE